MGTAIKHKAPCPRPD